MPFTHPDSTRGVRTWFDRLSDRLWRSHRPLTRNGKSPPNPRYSRKPPTPAPVSTGPVMRRRTARPTFKMTQKMRKNGKNGPSHRNNVSITKPSADIVTQSAIQYKTNPPRPYFRSNLTRKARETSE